MKNIKNLVLGAILVNVISSCSDPTSCVEERGFLRVEQHSYKTGPVGNKYCLAGNEGRMNVNQI